MPRTISGAVVAISLLGCASAAAQDAAEPAKAANTEAATEAAAAEASKFDFAFGAALTSDYMFRGITQSDHMPALQPYIESSYGIFYAGVWTSNVDYGVPDPKVEVDLYGGLRPTLGPVSADISALYYAYPGATASNYVEVKAAATVSPTDMITLGGEGDYAWDYAQLGDDSTYVEGNASISLPHDISVSGAVGYQMFGAGTGLSDYLTWNAGVSYTWKSATFDLRYHDTDLSADTCEAEYTRRNSCGARIVGTLSFDLSWSELEAPK